MTPGRDIYRIGAFSDVFLTTLPGDSPIIDLVVNNDGLLIATTAEGATFVVDQDGNIKLN